MLKWKDKRLVYAVTTRGVKLEDPAALPGCDLTARERESLTKRGWVAHRGTYYCPAAKTNGTLDRLEKHARLKE